VLQIFIALKNPSPWPGFEPATFVSSGQHTTKATNSFVLGHNDLPPLTQKPTTEPDLESQLNSVHTFTSYFLKKHFKTVLSS
jgi:hypothetical protein